MDFYSALSVIAMTAGVTVGVVCLWAYGHLRRIFHQTTERQLQHAKRMLEMIDKQQNQIETLYKQTNSLADQASRLTRAVTSLLERNGGGNDDDPSQTGNSQRLLH